MKEAQILEKVDLHTTTVLEIVYVLRGYHQQGYEAWLESREGQLYIVGRKEGSE